MRRRELFIAAALAVLSPSGVKADIGLAAKFGDVILEGARLGHVYNLREAAHVPFGIENKGDAEMEVGIEFSRPRTGQMSKDYEEKPATSEAFLQVAMTALMLRRLAPA